MAKTKSAPKQEVVKKTEPKIAWLDEDDYGRIAIRVGTVGEKKEKVNEVKNSWSAWDSWDRGYGLTPTAFDCDVETEPSCCGFEVLSNFSWDSKSLKGNEEMVGKALGEGLVDRKYKFLTAYIPHQKSYLKAEQVLQAAGFKPTVSLKSKHGKYHNVRWDWVNPTVEVKGAEAISAILV